MADFERDEEELKEFLKPLADKKPPAKVMQDYEKQVMARIRGGSGGPVIGLIPALAIVAVVGLAFAAWFVMRQPLVEVVKQPEPIIEEPVVKPIETPKEELNTRSEADDSDYSAQTEEDLFNEMSEDLFILEMLGEDEGILDDIGRMETDIEFLMQAAPAAI